MCGMCVPGVPCVKGAVDGAVGRGQCDGEAQGARAKGCEGLRDDRDEEAVPVEDAVPRGLDVWRL